MYVLKPSKVVGLIHIFLIASFFVRLDLVCYYCKDKFNRLLYVYFFFYENFTKISFLKLHKHVGSM
jgi:hypothetical protein